MALRKVSAKSQTKAAPKVIDINPLDPEQINSRLYRQVSELLKQLEDKDEDITIRERIAALVAIGRLQQVFAALRKAAPSDQNRGSTVKKYATAFSNAAGGRDTHAGPCAWSDSEPGDWFERGEYAPAGDASDGDADSDDAAE